MIKNENVRKIRQIKNKIQYGDYITLGAMLGCRPDAAKKRFLRGNREAEEALLLIFLNRERLIRDFREKKEKIIRP